MREKSVWHKCEEFWIQGKKNNKVLLIVHEGKTTSGLHQLLTLHINLEKCGLLAIMQEECG